MRDFLAVPAQEDDPPDTRRAQRAQRVWSLGSDGVDHDDRAFDLPVHGDEDGGRSIPRDPPANACRCLWHWAPVDQPACLTQCDMVSCDVAVDSPTQVLVHLLWKLEVEPPNPCGGDYPVGEDVLGDLVERRRQAEQLAGLDLPE